MVLIYQANLISLTETVILQTVMTYGHILHKSITNVHQQIFT